MLLHPAMRSTAPFLALALVCTLTGDRRDGSGLPVAPPVAPAAAAVATTLAQQQFVPNLGQWDAEVRFAAFGDTLGWLHDDGFTVRFERWSAAASSADNNVAPRTVMGNVVRTRFLDASAPEFETQQELPTRRHFFVGERARWRADVPAFASVTLRGVQPGIDVAFRGLPDGKRGPFEYDLLLAPGADLARFRARLEGVQRLRLDGEGRLCARFTFDGVEHDLVQEAPIAWQQTASGPQPLPVAFRLLDEVTYGFVADERDPALAAVVDPGVVWGTFLGGGLTDSVNAMRWREGIGVWVGGWASSTNFPTTPGAFRTTGGNDGFVARLNDAGTTLQFATYLGGVRNEEVRGLQLGPGDTPCVVGYTQSIDFPVTPGALQTSYGGASLFLDLGDGFVTRLAANGASLVTSTYLGGNLDDIVEDLHVDVAGVMTVTGWTSSSNFPTTAGVVQPVLAGIPGAQSDGFVTRFTANGQGLAFSTHFGGWLSDTFVAIDREPVTGDFVCVGWTVAAQYPVTPNVVRPISSGLCDGVVTRISSTGATAVFSTYLGGLGNDYAMAVRVAADSTIWVGGNTFSANWPTSPGAPQTVFAGDTDGFVTQISANGQTLGFSTLVGGPGGDKVRALALGPSGMVAVGEAGPGFPVTTNAVQSLFGGGNLDGFVNFYTNGGNTLAFASYFGGANQESFGSIDLAASGIAVAGGWTFSSDFPIAPAGLQGSLLGVEDGIVMKFDLISSFGDSLVVGPDPVEAPVVVEAGEHELLRTTLSNVSPRALAIDAVDVLVAGAGVAPLQLTGLRVFCDAGSPVVSTLVAGPLPVPVDDRELAIALTGCVVPANGSAVLRVVGDVATNALGRTIEVAVAIVDTDAWTVRAIGAGAGPEVRVLGSGRAAGRRLVVGALPGDADRDGAQSVVDVRRLLVTLGSADAAVDIDGDGVVGMNEVIATRDAVLGRAVVLTSAAMLHPGEWFTLGGVFPDDSLQATLGGRALTLGQVTPREATFRVPSDLSPGTYELLVTLGGRVVLSVLIGVS
jgi:hypothetical protein